MRKEGINHTSQSVTQKNEILRTRREVAIGAMGLLSAGSFIAHRIFRNSESVIEEVNRDSFIGKTPTGVLYTTLGINLGKSNIYNDIGEILEVDSIRRINHSEIPIHEPFVMTIPLLTQSPLNTEKHAIKVIIESILYHEDSAGYIPLDEIQENYEDLMASSYMDVTIDNNGFIQVNGERLPKHIEDQLGKVYPQN